MRSPVHEVFLVSWPVRILVLDICLVDQAQSQEFTLHDQPHFFVVILDRNPRIEQVHGRSHHTKDSIIHCSLTWCKSSIHGNGTCHICIVVAIFGSDIHEQEFASLTSLVVFDVMQDAGTCSRSDDGLIGKALASIADKLMEVFGFDLVLSHTRFDKRKHPSKTLFGDIARMLELVDFFWLFDRSQLMHDGCSSVVSMKWIFFFAKLDHSRVSCLYDDPSTQMLVCVEVDAIG